MTMHDGHRKRMRERFRENGMDGFAPHEVLELLLFYGRARGDVNPLAHALIDAFGSLQGVLEASPEQLMTVSGIGEETATLITMMVPLFRRYISSVLREKIAFTNRYDALDYARALMAGWRMERFYVVCLDADLRVLGHRLVAEGSLDEVQAYPRRVVEVALNYNAHSVVLVHNHPGGSVLPSVSDIDATRRLQRALEGLDIMLQDHIIVAGTEARSMVMEGDLKVSPLQLLTHKRIEGKKTE